MNIRRHLTLLALVVLAILIWIRDRAWQGEMADTLPVALALPLFAWLGHPWKWRSQAAPLPRAPLAAGLLFLAAGLAVNLTLLLAAGWCLMLHAALVSLTTAYPRRLLALAMLGFPWIAQSGAQVGWWFRLSGAGAAGGLFSVLGFEVQREGTFLTVQGLPLSVEAACSGLHVLQALLVAGTVLVCLHVPPGRRFWLFLAALVPLAWLANTVRIITLGVAALSWGADFAMGWFHQFGGWIVLCIMFIICRSVLFLGLSRKRISIT